MKKKKLPPEFGVSHIKRVRFTKWQTIRGYLTEYFIIFKVLDLFGFSSIHYRLLFQQNKMSSSVQKDCVAIILKFLEDHNFKETAHT